MSDITNMILATMQEAQAPQQAKYADPRLGGSQSAGPQLYESEAFQQAVEMFAQQYGREPATDSDMMEVERIMTEGAAPSRPEMEDDLLRRLLDQYPQR